MASVVPKLGLYAFLSMICLLINVSLLVTVMISTGAGDFGDFIDSDTYDVYNEAPDDGDYSNATAVDFAVASGGSFVPFFSLLNIATFIDDVPLIVSAITTVVIGIISAFQILLLTTIILNFAPKILGSGFDV